MSRPGSPYLAGAPLLMAHRGGAGLAPENTLLAFQQAISWWNADILEMDVHLTRDGEVVVIHDASVDRTTDGSGSVSSMTFAELQRLDAGYRFSPDGGKSFPYRGVGVRIPSLFEVLQALPGTRMNVEIKDGDAQERLLQLVASESRRVLIAAEEKKNRARFADYSGAISASAGELRSFYLAHRAHLARKAHPRVDALQLPDRHDGKQVLSPRLVGDAHRHNVPVHVWTVNEETDMRRLLEWGVDGIITDRPDRLSRVLHEFSERPLPPGAPKGVAPPSVERLLRP